MQLIVSKDNRDKYGIIDFDTNAVIVPHKYDEIIIRNESIRLKMDAKWALLSINELYKISDAVSKPKYLFFDTETTGVPKDYKAPMSDLNNWPRLVQLAWILCDEEGNEIDSKNLIICPSNFTIPVEASRVHNITTEFALKEGVDLENALGHFTEASKYASTYVGHNISFDINVVGAELLRVGNSFDIMSKSSVCTMLKTINYCAIPSENPKWNSFKYPKLQELYMKLFGHEFDDAHDAMADIRATKECFFELQRRGIINSTFPNRPQTVDKSLAEDFANAILAIHKYQLMFPTYITNMKNVIDCLLFDKTLLPKDAPLFARYMLEFVQGGWDLPEDTIASVSSHILNINAELETPFDSSLIGSVIQAVNMKRECSISDNGYTYVVRKMRQR